MNETIRTKIPVYTRSKLLHDAWNLAYAGDLCFGTALNMTLFLKHEREYLAWDPLFTMIDHIGRHIDSSDVHKKFQVLFELFEHEFDELGWNFADFPRTRGIIIIIARARNARR